MRSLTSLDHKILNHKPENIFKVVSNFETYPEWFGKDVRLKSIKTTQQKIGSVIKVKFGIIGFEIELMRVNPNYEIFVKYSGAYSGQGVWYFFETTNGTKLMYEIDLKIRNPLVWFTSLFVNIARLHSEIMAKIFRNLEEYLNKIYGNSEDGLNSSSDPQSKIFFISRD